MTDLLDFHLRAALRRAPADPDLLALKGSVGDTLSREEALRYLKDWFERGFLTKKPRARSSTGQSN